MVGATDVEKLRMRIKCIKRDIKAVLDKAWWDSEGLKEVGDGANVPKYFIEKYGITPEAINEAYFLGRQDGRLTMAMAVKEALGGNDES